jgi:hypothetical protein
MSDMLFDEKIPFTLMFLKKDDPQTLRFPPATISPIRAEAPSTFPVTVRGPNIFAFE